MPGPQSITYQGKEYKSVSSLAKHLDISQSLLSQRIKMGWDERYWKSGKRKGMQKITYKNVQYRSLNALSKAIDIPYKTLEWRIDQGWEEERWADPPTDKTETCKANNERLVAEKASTFDDRLKEVNPNIVRRGVYQANDIKIAFYCKIHDREFEATPADKLRGSGCDICTQESKIESGRKTGSKWGPINGRNFEELWRVLADLERGREPTKIYLFNSPDTPLNKYGITSNLINKRKSQSKLPGTKSIEYGDLLIEPREYADRDHAVAIEAAYKYGYGIEGDPELGYGFTELTDATPEEFLERIEFLETKFNELGLWQFAREYCDPLQVRKANESKSD